MHFIFELSFLHRHTSNFISLDSSSHYTTLDHFYHHIYRLYQSFSNNSLQIIDSYFPIIDSSLHLIGFKLPTIDKLPIIDIKLLTTDTLLTPDNFTLPRTDTLPTTDNFPIVDFPF